MNVATMIWGAVMDEIREHLRRAFGNAPIATTLSIGLMILITIFYALDAIHA